MVNEQYPKFSQDIVDPPEFTAEDKSQARKRLTYQKIPLSSSLGTFFFSALRTTTPGHWNTLVLSTLLGSNLDKKVKPIFLAFLT